MVIINLIPWREHLHQFQRREMLKLILLAILLSSLITFVTHTFIGQKISKIKSDIELLLLQKDKLENASNHLSSDVVIKNDLHRQVERKKIAAMDYLRKLDSAAKYHVCFHQLNYKQGKFTLIGNVESLYTLSNFLKNYQYLNGQFPLLLKHIKHNHQEFYNFTVKTRD